MNAWQETNSFSIEKRAVLKLTEEITNIKEHVSDQTYNDAINILGEKLTAKVIVAAMAINAWNRMAIATRMLPED